MAGTTIEAEVFPSKQGITRIAIPPLGQVRAKTHVLPVNISISIERVSINQLRRLASAEISQDQLMNQAERELGSAARRFGARLLLLAVIGGTVAGLILPGRNWKRVLAAALIGALAFAVPALLLVRTYDIKAWRQPKYTGMLTAAPWLLGTLEDKINDLDAFRKEMRGLAGNVYKFYDKVSGWEPVTLGNGTLKVLHVGDIHNNPAAMDLIARVVRDFNVDFVIDTGDLTDMGTPIEADLIGRVSRLKVPYVFVPGNHDSESVLSALREQENTIVIDDDMTEVKGLKVFGMAGPAAYEFNAEPVSGEELAVLNNKITRKYRALDEKPDIVAVHSIKLADDLIGKAPLILTGHTHRPDIKVKDGTLIDDVGTTGAAGIRNFKVSKDLPYTLKLLHFSEKSKKLLAIDSLSLSGATRDFNLDRRLVESNRSELKNPSDSANFNLSWQKVSE